MNRWWPSYAIKDQQLTQRIHWALALALAGCVPATPRPDLGGQIDAAVPGAAVAVRTTEAETGHVGDTLTLPAAVRLAVVADPDVRAAVARARASEADADQIRLLPNPIVTMALRFPTDVGTPVDVGLTEDVLAIVQRPARAEAADGRLRAAAADVVTAVLDSVAAVQERYAAVQALDAVLPVLAERVALTDRLLAVARARLAAGEGTRIDVTTLEAQRLELDVEQSERQLDRRTERLALARLIGRPADDVGWAVDRWQPVAAAAADEPAWVAAALLHRPEIAAGTWELAALGVDVRLARFWPFGGDYVGAAIARDAGTPVYSGPSFSVPIPLFDWGQAQVSLARAKADEQRHRLTGVRRRVVEDVRSRLAELTATAAMAERVRGELLPAQQRRQDQTEAAYRAGEADVVTLVLAQQDYQATRTKLIDLQRRATVARVRLQRATGGAGPASAVEIREEKGTTDAHR